MGTTTCRLHLYLTGTTSVSSHAHTCSRTLTQTHSRFSWHIQHVKCKKKLRVAIPSEGVRVAFCSELQKATFYKFPESAFTFIISCMNC